MVKRLIYQVCVGKPSRLYDFCTQTVKEYADSIGSDYHKQTSPILKIRPDPFNTNRSKEAVERLGYLPIFEKENAFDMLDEYDEICIIDSDVYIRPNSPSIFEQLQPGNCFSACIESTMPITQQYMQKILNYSRMQYSDVYPKLGISPGRLGYDFCNMGIMLFTKDILPYMKTKDAKSFIERIEFKNFVDGTGPWKWSTDQTLLNTWIRMDKVPWNNLSWKFNGLYGANTKIGECHFVHFFLKDKLPNKGENIEELLKKI